MVEEDNVSLQRLGKRELGPYAFETCMPSSITQILKNESDENKTTGVIPKLAQLLEFDQSIEAAFLCNTSVVQVAKLPNEGNTFCGYRNVQMLLSSLDSINASFEQEDLTVPHLQDMIEKAWDAGFNNHARIQTGGIKGTRKHVGSSEAEAILLHHNIPCSGTSFTSFNGNQAHVDLLDFVEQYFSSPRIHSKPPLTTQHTKVQLTAHPPIFLQRPQHSISIIGLEKLDNGKRRLLVFDPAWQTPGAMRQPGPLPASLVESRWSRASLLWRYRKPSRYLRRFTAFETVSIDVNVGEELATTSRK